jgi:hypothetical protein
MVPRRTERIFGDEPPGWEDDKVGNGSSRVSIARRREHREDRGVRMVEGDAADGVEATKVILVGVIEAVPGNNVERGVVLASCKESTGEFIIEGPT